MICWKPAEPSPEIEELGEFLEALQHGSTAYAHPKTVANLEGKVQFPIKSCSWIEEGALWAVPPEFTEGKGMTHDA